MKTLLDIKIGDTIYFLGSNLTYKEYKAYKVTPTYVFREDFYSSKFYRIGENENFFADKQGLLIEVEKRKDVLKGKIDKLSKDIIFLDSIKLKSLETS